MPIVPTYGAAPRVATSGGFDGALSGGDDRSAQIGAQQTANLGGALTQSGESLGRVAIDMQQMVNQTRVNDAQNQLRETILQKTYDPTNGYLALKGKAALDPDDNGQALPDRYASDVQNIASMISDRLGNDAQRREFNLQAQNMVTQLRGDAERHMMGEFVAYHNSVQDGTIDLSAEQAKAAWNNPERIAPAVDSIKAAIYQKGQLNGWSASQIEAAMLKTTSAVHKDVVMAALENNNPTYALGYLDRHKADMSADDILRVQGQVNQSVWSAQALGAVQVASTKLQTQIMPGDADRAFNIALGTESGNRQFDSKGQPLTSPKGAIGAAQVMPTTAPEAAKLAGLPWDENRYKNDAEYNRALGRAYFNKQVQDFGGDLGRAYAAYNAGPGAVREAMKKAERAGDRLVPAKPDDYLAYLPKETQNYVAKNLAKYGSGGGAPSRPTESDFISTALEQLPPGASPQALKLTREQAKQQYDLLSRSLKDSGDSAVSEAQQWIIQNGGNFTQLPVPLRSRVMQYAPDKYDSLMKFAGEIAAGPPTKTDWNTYTQLRAMASSNPVQFGKTDLRSYYPQLAPTQREQLLDLQMKAKDPKQHADVASLSEQLSNAHNLLGFGRGDAVKKGQFDDAVTQQLAAETRAKGKPLDFAERDKVIKRMMLPTTGGGWFSTPRMYQSAGTPDALTAQPKLSDNDRTLIIAALKGEGLQPTEANIQARFKLRYGIR